MIVVDTSVWIDYFRGNPTPSVVKLRTMMANGVEIGLTDLNLMEILQGCTTNAEVARLEAATESFEIVTGGGREVGLLAAKHYRILRKAGFTARKEVDVWIATLCIVNDLALLHSDRDFDPMQKHLGLRSVPVA